MHLSLETPLGPVTIHETDGALSRLDWHAQAGSDEESPLLRDAARQLAAYFAGELKAFDLPWRIDASPSQIAICTAIAAIPWGETRTYGDIAKDLRLPAQAVGQGCGGNPLPVIVPCHRVLGATGLGGFSARGGVETKVWLLRHESAAGLLI